MDRKIIEKELNALISGGFFIYFASVMMHDKNFFLDNPNHDEYSQEFAMEAVAEVDNPHGSYHAWYDAVCQLLSISKSKRLTEFELFYTNHVQGWLINPKDDDPSDYRFNKFESGFRMQRDILSAIAENFDKPLFNLERDIRHDIYKSEIDIAKDLDKQGYLRASGAIAGVILEVHLKNLTTKRGVMPKKKNPGMSDYNDALKDDIYDTATWRQIQTCGDIRNLCVHPKKTEPTKYQINTIISTAEQIITTHN